MRITAGLVQDDEYNDFWHNLAGIGDLGARETEIIADTARRGIHENFKREQSPDGTPWTPLAPYTQQQRRAGIDERGIPFSTGAEHPILRRTDDLLLSFVNPRHPRNITIADHDGWNTRITLGAVDDPQTPNRIATLHAGGTTATGRIVPPRPFVGLGTKAIRQLEAQALAILTQRVKNL
jgi:hypothetical protein